VSVESSPRSLNRFQVFAALRTAHPVGGRKLPPGLAENAMRFPGARPPYGLPTIIQVRSIIRLLTFFIFIYQQAGNPARINTQHTHQPQSPQSGAVDLRDTGARHCPRERQRPRPCAGASSGDIASESRGQPMTPGYSPR
jgi:hypothetical protein